MKTPLFRCLSLLTALLLLVGCSAGNAQAPIDPMIRQLMDELPRGDGNVPGDETIVKTADYTIYRKDGQCYLDFNDGNHWVDLYDEDSCIIPSNELWFYTPEELYQFLSSGDISGREDTIRYGFPVDQKNGFLWADPDNFYVTDIPEGYEYFYSTLQGNEYKYVLRTLEMINDQSFGVIDLTFCSEETFAERLTWHYRLALGQKEYDTTYTVDEHNATVYEYDMPAGRYRQVQYQLTTPTLTLFVDETHQLTSNDGSPINQSVYPTLSVLGCVNGVYFILDPPTNDPDQLLELIDTLNIHKYEP